jgi:hypothetical protein
MTSIILHGFSNCLQPPHQPPSKPSTYGSVLSMDMILTAAYTEQYHSIGWFHFVLGRVSNKWTAAIALYRQSNAFAAPYYAISLLIDHLRTFTKAMWQHCNALILGATVEENAARVLSDLHHQLNYHYQQFQEDPTYVLARHQYLFLNRTKEQRLQHSYDYLVCWLRSVEEGRHSLAYHLRSLRSEAARFFPHSDSSSSSYRPTSSPSTCTSLIDTSQSSSTSSITSGSFSSSFSSSSLLVSCNPSSDSLSEQSLFQPPFQVYAQHSSSPETLIS